MFGGLYDFNIFDADKISVKQRMDGLRDGGIELVATKGCSNSYLPTGRNELASFRRGRQLTRHTSHHSLNSPFNR
jgi:hypothetical protein